MIRIKDIAEMAGVSTTTVSNVIHGHHDKVSKKTIRIVQDFLRETNYVPNLAAHLLAKKDSKIIAIVVYGNAQRANRHAGLDPFLSEVIQSAESMIRNYGYYMIFHVIEKDLTEITTLAMTWNLSGIILIGVGPLTANQVLRNIQIPFVTLDAYLNDPAFPNVGSDDFGGGYAVGQHLFKLGHHQVRFLSDNKLGVDYERWNGFVFAYQEQGIDLSENHHLLLKKQIDEREEQIIGLIPEFRRCSALFFASDFYAVESMLILQDTGFKIPENIAIVGYDNNVLSELVRPKLTTVSQNTQHKCFCAIERLIRMIHGEKLSTHDYKLPVELIVRDSTLPTR
ncbi:MAG: LacI family transcriptional regulator [Firmicutes bacterium HGW-Firmicutes-3]|jgi:LacI family transcriptional regulator|nr:MAG: LacI family transcriptional regulator [Firmicutes bacterium HGW-Firmicutes-3]